MTDTKHEDSAKEGPQIVNYYSAMAAGVGLIPIPVVDIAAVIGVQVRMLQKLGQLYGQPITNEWAKKIIGVVLADTSGVALTSSVIKLLPPLSLLGQLAVPAAAGAATYALGSVFLEHFASGGTVLDFRPEKVKARVEAFKAAYRAQRAGAASTSHEVAVTHAATTQVADENAALRSEIERLKQELQESHKKKPPQAGKAAT